MHNIIILLATLFSLTAQSADKTAYKKKVRQLSELKKALAEKRARLEALIKATEAYLADCRKSLESNRVNLENYIV